MRIYPAGYIRDDKTARLVFSCVTYVREAFNSAVVGDKIVLVGERIGLRAPERHYAFSFSAIHRRFCQNDRSTD